MHLLDFLYPALLALSALAPAVEATRKPNIKSVRLADVKSLTLRKDRMTAHRRVSAIPQLKCTGGDARGLYDVDLMRCINAGTSYDNDDVEWTCTASLPEEFKLGSTDVICEGYNSPDDPFILKGSCGVEYRLLLTDKGEEKYGHGNGGKDKDLWDGYRRRGDVNWGAIIFWGIFLSVLGWIVYNAFLRRPGNTRAGGTGGGLGWGGGGPGPGPGPDDNDDPPPPYDYGSPWPGNARKPGESGPSTSNPQGPPAGAAPGQGQQGWRPGFWTGALGGAAAGYLAGNRGNGTRLAYGTGGRGWGGNGDISWWNNNNDPFEGGSSRPSGGGGRSGSGSSSFSSTRHESTGFGSTSRR